MTGAISGSRADLPIYPLYLNEIKLLVASKPDDMPCEENAARVLASMGIMPSDSSREGAPPSPGRSASRPKR